ncbi:hypothetical protein ACWT_4714 [Actinoplanes sp. SE50]|uniref:hypothetical protein n=1 Tax=unclassified Actinoplanes TaxID=2626549 RepID=UPI00023EBF4B|nr:MULTISPECIES: hypothetical protein [unclassified Actinoplanes]AEV85736.1 hypothetical protein ACPL_4845 [Actinoplanes sp. SE50/110]ATO84129.1 hypothetical protein ACWT_4714 [Actinoplanes sp. SE50]SLM01539.1 hypothetical protein ACSP50_4775 [Actinoplanes sp. SE50/110]
MLFDQLRRRRPVAAPADSPVQELPRWKLTPERRDRYRHDVFEQELDEVLGAGSLADGTVSTDFLRRRCLRERDALGTPAQDAWQIVDRRLVDRARVRDRLDAGALIAYEWAFTPGLRRLILSLGMALWLLAFAYAGPGEHRLDYADPVLLWAAGVLVTGSAAASIAEFRGVRHPGLFVTQAFATALAAGLTAVAGMQVKTVAIQQSGLVPVTVVMITTVVLAVLLVAFQSWGHVDRHWSTARLADLRVPVVTGAILIGLISLTALGTILILGAGTANRRLDVVRPELWLAVPGSVILTLNLLAGLFGYSSTPFEIVDSRWRTAEREWREMLRNRILLPLLRRMVNDARPSYDTTLYVTRPHGLSQAFDPIYEVPTRARERLEKILTMLPGGSVGLAGPRGVGKSTILASFCEHRAESAGTIRVLVSAPVDYAPRDFLLHLYAQICRAALGLHDGHRPPPDPIHWLSARRPLWAGSLLAGLTGAAGLGILILSGSQYRLGTSQIIAVIMLLVATGLGAHLAARRAPRPSSGYAPEDTLRDAALERLREIEYQQSIAGEYSGAVKVVPAGLESSLKRSTGFVRQQLSLPEIVDSLRRFLKLAAAQPRPAGGPALVIGIDELDKIEDETRAQQFLNDIKSIFGVAGCHFLVSVSEDAMASFERRGLPFRDVFDSAFDEIASIPYLAFKESSDLVGRRTTEIPIPFKGLAFCLSGGLPRDLIRAARTMVEISEKGSRDLPAIAARLVARDLTGKADAVAAAIRKVDAEPATSRLMLWCRAIAGRIADDGDFTAAMDDLKCIDMWGREEANRAALRRLAREITAYAYYCRTLVGFFALPQSAGILAAYDELAAIRRAMAANPLVGWTLTSEFRQRRRMPEVYPPDALTVLPAKV